MTDWFFLSYERKDRIREQRVRQFFDALIREIKDIVSFKENEQIGFIDQTMKPGDLWPKRLTRELATCHTFIALITRNYFNRNFCGKEWGIFEQRLQAHRDQNELTELPPLLITIPWAYPREGDFPEFAKERHFDIDPHGTPGATSEHIQDYNEYGLSYILKRVDSIYRDAFTTIAEQLAKHIVDLAQEHPLPEANGDIPSLTNAPNRFMNTAQVPIEDPPPAPEFSTAQPKRIIDHGQDQELPRLRGYTGRSSHIADSAAGHL